MKKLIVCAGRGRSGSVLQYNLIRLTLIKAFGEENVYGRSHRSYKKKHPADYHVVKSHDHVQYLWDRADYVFSCRRASTDQIRSWRNHQKKHKGVDRTDKEVRKFMEFDYNRFKRWSQHKNFVGVFEYDDMINKRWKIIKRICEILGVEVQENMRDVITEVDNIPLPSKGYDHTTCLTQYHIDKEKK